jgi:2-polyprenyl-3-methyl-5-hydroxy-6-metoxy-1,4-benzoquinol methylase
MINRAIDAVRWRLGMRVVAPELRRADRAAFTAFYNDRVTDCRFLGDTTHYEHPRAAWILGLVPPGSRVLELGCGNGGMTKLLAATAKSVLAVDVSQPSLREVESLGLHNVTTKSGLIEELVVSARFDVVVLSEVIEHVPDPGSVLRAALSHLDASGTLLVTTPNGHWENHEHLHEFSAATLARLITTLPHVESFNLGYLRDDQNRRRWLVGALRPAEAPPTPDDFFGLPAARRLRRRGVAA